MIAIKDFGMPSCCSNCEMFNWTDEACHITYTRCEEPFDDRNDDCPLIEIEPQEKEMPWYLSIFNTELLKQKGHWITDDAWSDIAYNTEFLEFLYNHINPNDMEHYRQMFEMKDAVAVNGAEMESSDADSD